MGALDLNNASSMVIIIIYLIYHNSYECTYNMKYFTVDMLFGVVYV